MEEALLERLQLRHAKLLKLLSQATFMMEQEGGVQLEVFSKLKMDLRLSIEALERQSTQFIEKCTSVTLPNMTEYMKDQMKAEDMLTSMETVLLTNRTEKQSRNETTRLPKLDLLKFNGDPLKWTEFWDRFEATIGCRSIGDVEKLSYLLSSLEGRALQTVEGLDTTNANYPIAVEALKRMFGSKDKVVDAHYDALNQTVRSSRLASDCRQTLNKIEKHLRVLATLGEDVGGSHLRVLILSKFPENVLYQVNLLTFNSPTVPSIREALNSVVSALEMSEVTPTAGPSAPSSAAATLPSSSAAALHLKVEGRRESRKRKWQPTKSDSRDIKQRTQTPHKRSKRFCIFCNGDSHYSEDCLKHKTYKERIAMLKDRCYVCFRSGHVAKKCTDKRMCLHCNRKHNRALCRLKTKGDNTNERSDNNDTSTTTTILTKNLILLQTAVAQARARDRSVPCRILLDSGSQRSYITATLAKELNLIPDKEDHLTIYTFGSNKPREVSSSSAEITVITKRGIEIKLRVNIVPHITDRIPVVKIESLSVDIMADDDSTGESIDLLIGNDLYFSFLRTERLKLQNNAYLVDTDFGWIVSGNVKIQESEKDTLTITTYCQCHDTGCPYFTEPDLPLRSIDIKFLWALESIGITDSPKATREEEAVQHFNRTVEYSDGRYQVKWPWVQYPPVLSANYGLALGRLKSLLRRSNKEMLNDYNQILQEQLQSEVIEVVDPVSLNQIPHPVHYLPHHMVKQGDKRGRIVYDASAKVKDEKSLNECMYRGPSMLEDLTGLLLKFRMGIIGMTADVEKAFLQVGLQEEDRDVTRFLWVKDPMKELTDDNLIHFRFRRVPFGIISSPFLLTATIRYHMSRTKDALLTKIADKCYVDNLVTSAKSVHEALELQNETTKVFNELGMNIRDWTSNNKEFMEKIPTKQRAKQADTIKILGLSWNLQKDTLRLNIDKLSIASAIEEKGVTKKIVLSTLARLYDPCGFASPLVLPGKLFFQELCTQKLKWDEALPEESQLKWKTIVKDLKATKDIEIPRYVANGVTEEVKEYQLHCFTDSSKNSFAAVVYLRVIAKHEIKASFLMSKSRVTPMEDKDDLKIPKLELLGYVIGSRLLKYINSHLELKVSKVYLWTDSQVVLAWMKSNKLLPPFVSRRVNEIRQTQNALDMELCYVNTKENPADVATRPELWHQKRDLWFHGPNFLSKEEREWPKNKQSTQAENICLAGEALGSIDGPEMSIMGYEDEDMLDDQTDLTTSCDSKERPKASQPTTDSDESLTEIKDLQKSHFPDEVSGKETNLTRNLGLFLDVEGVLRSKGRMAHTSWPYDKKHPVLIPKDSVFTDRVIQKVHQDNYHVGVSHTLNLLREKYWIPQGRAKVQRMLKRCPECIKHGGGPYQLPPTPALPAERVRFSEPFTFTGMDYFGPMFVQTSTGTREKRWICLFTCLAVRAIHLEVVRDLTAGEGLMALRRFIASRNKPNLIVSDNATTFKLMSEILIDTGIRWKFIPQLAPWHGGVYERLVGLVKHCLKRTLDKHMLQDGQLLTVMKEVEAVVNTRPLTNVGAEVEQVLRPADFLSLGKCLELSPQQEPPLEGTETKIDLLKSWKRGRTILSEFKEMFKGQYLPSLRERYKHHLKQPRVKSIRQPNVGDIVQIKDDSKNRNNWKVGKITTLMKGQDGECRVAKVRVGEQDFTRSVGHLYPLEADMNVGDVSPTANVEGSIEDIVIPQHDHRPELRVIELPDLETRPNQSPESMEVDLGPTIEDSPAQVEVESGEAEVLPISIDSEASQEVAITPESRVRREAAIRAREKIAEWTRQLLALL